MKDRDKLVSLLNAFKLGLIDFDCAVYYILKVYTNSKRFNWNSFSLGLFIGEVLMYVVMKYIV
ncbi:MAG: hypothetical protein ACRCX2_09755 [Paraclostridium sp.]